MSLDCPVCGKPCKDQQALSDHRRNNHAPKLHKCPEPTCDKTFAKPSEATKHHNKIHLGIRNEKFKCLDPKCKKGFPNNYGMLRHYNAVHGDKVQCTADPANCSREFTSEDALNSHIKGKHLGYRWPCGQPGCTETFEHPSTRSTHLWSKHDGAGIDPAVTANLTKYKPNVPTSAASSSATSQPSSTSIKRKPLTSSNELTSSSERSVDTASMEKLTSSDEKVNTEQARKDRRMPRINKKLAVLKQASATTPTAVRPPRPTTAPAVTSVSRLVIADRCKHPSICKLTADQNDLRYCDSHYAAYCDAFDCKGDGELKSSDNGKSQTERAATSKTAASSSTATAQPAANLSYHEHCMHFDSADKQCPCRAMYREYQYCADHLPQGDYPSAATSWDPAFFAAFNAIMQHLINGHKSQRPREQYTLRIVSVMYRTHRGGEWKFRGIDPLRPETWPAIIWCRPTAIDGLHTPIDDSWFGSAAASREGLIEEHENSNHLMILLADVNNKKHKGKRRVNNVQTDAYQPINSQVDDPSVQLCVPVLRGLIDLLPEAKVMIFGKWARAIAHAHPLLKQLQFDEDRHPCCIVFRRKDTPFEYKYTAEHWLAWFGLRGLLFAGDVNKLKDRATGDTSVIEGLYCEVRSKLHPANVTFAQMRKWIRANALLPDEVGDDSLDAHLLQGCRFCQMSQLHQHTDLYPFNPLYNRVELMGFQPHYCKRCNSILLTRKIAVQHLLNLHGIAAASADLHLQVCYTAEGQLLSRATGELL